MKIDRLKLPPIYPITDKMIAAKTSHLAIVRELAHGGARLIQIRDKETPLRELLLDLNRCVEFCAKHGITLIVNDRCDVVLSCGAGGVHLGQDDLPPQAARRLLRGKYLIGYSTRTIAEVRRAGCLPVDYLGFGPVFPTTTKQVPGRTAGLMGLKRACLESKLPVVAIGGIGLSEVRPVLEAGASSAAVISALMGAKNIARQMEAMLEAARVTG